MLKVGDKIVLSYIQDMEPGVVRKIDGDKAMVDLGGTKLFSAKLDELVLVEDTAEIEFSPASQAQEDLLPKINASLDESSTVSELLEKVTAGIKFEDEYGTIENRLGEPEQVRETISSDFYIGASVRRIGGKKTGKIIMSSKADSSYQVRWDDNTVTTSWKSELGLI